MSSEGTLEGVLVAEAMRVYAHRARYPIGSVVGNGHLHPRLCELRFEERLVIAYLELRVSSLRSNPHTAGVWAESVLSKLLGSKLSTV